MLKAISFCRRRLPRQVVQFRLALRSFQPHFEYGRVRTSVLAEAHDAQRSELNPTQQFAEVYMANPEGQIGRGSS